ncbi:GGDEF domain-containing protein [Paenibacillus qinlingensis]|uniref:Diguanylate cyclase (GGDEF)-like protein n=1 Tax=Paenibacillus qinlingensis TaxID=1837343 RepID=A0ABU1NZK3_9BACL|nr:GGDEF domain-containing protein [Paenibacillus qinlingensis]MDR6552516.1 diguanylate cyclase (GGDEF)-like protein [Paenibacillus qinlingensis]
MVKIRKSDHILEMAYSCVRWFLLIASFYLYFNNYYSSSQNLTLFLSLAGVAILYMTTTEIALHRTPIASGFYHFMTRIGVVMDYFAFIAIIAFTDGTHSPLLPIAYLIILHASLYWSFRGAMVATGMIIIGYCFVVVLVDGGFYPIDLLRHLLNFAFLLMFGVIGGIIVARERKHFVEKGIFENLAKQDYLTGLYNHRSFQEQMREAVASKHGITLMMGDIDCFKQINDRYGHQAGDMVLREIGSLLSESIPSTQGRAFRYGGEEFAIILYTNNQQKATEQFQVFMDKLKAKVFEHGKAAFQVTMSFGAALRDQGQGKSELVAAADALLYEAKTHGKDQLLWGREEGMKQ